MLEQLEQVFCEVKPDAVVVFGDTNSTLAGALAAVKLSMPIVHVEAGLRSFRAEMPEEINRKLTDHMASVLLCPNAVAVENLKREGIAGDENSAELAQINGRIDWNLKKGPLVCNVGDIMVDGLRSVLSNNINLDVFHEITDKEYVLVTLHRAESTDDDDVFRYLVNGIIELSNSIDVIFPVHPRTLKKLIETGLLERIKRSNVSLLEPLSYTKFIALQSRARVIVTDSGGVQKEAYLLARPCITLRDETEWTETVLTGWNQLIGRYPEKLVDRVLSATAPSGPQKDLFGDGRAAIRIAACIQSIKYTY